MEIMLKIWDYWFFICSGIALFILYVEITTKVNGANGLIWLVITSLLACATLVLWFISIIFLELGTLFLYLFYSIMYFIIYIFLSAYLTNYFSNRSRRNRF